MNNIKADRNRQIEQLFDEGWTLVEIAEKFGLAGERIRQIVKSRKENRRKYRQLKKLKEKGAF